MYNFKKDSALLPHFLFAAAWLLLLVASLLSCLFWGDDFRHPLVEPQRVVIRSVLYGVAIILFPLTKLMRHVLIRLNRTMPGDEFAARRYLWTIVVSLSMIESVGGFGLLMFVLGDGVNTLYIFGMLAALGLYLHMPRPGEYAAIQAALTLKTRA